MRADLLDVVCCYSNPVRWESRLRLHKQFEKHMLESGVRLTTVECAYGDRPFDLEDNPKINRVRVRAKTLVWIKEALINIGIARLPHDWRYVAWIDADIHFRNKDWASETVHELQQYDILQPWSEAYLLGPDGSHMQIHKSFAHQFWHGLPVAKKAQRWWRWEGGNYDYAHCGFAWAATRNAIERLGGLLDHGAMGSGDHHMAHALVGEARYSMPGWISDGYKKLVDLWQHRAMAHINKNIGYVDGIIEHAFHGSAEKRSYVDRWGILKRHAFDPVTDLKKNIYGVPELTGSKPGLRIELDRYFRHRAEDSNTA